MSKHVPGGATYTTADLIRMAKLEYFGQYSAVVARALIKLSMLEEENKKLRETLSKYDEKTPDPQGKVINII